LFWLLDADGDFSNSGFQFSELSFQENTLSVFGFPFSAGLVLLGVHMVWE